MLNALLLDRSAQGKIESFVVTTNQKDVLIKQYQFSHKYQSYLSVERISISITFSGFQTPMLLHFRD